MTKLKYNNIATVGGGLLLIIALAIAVNSLSVTDYRQVLSDNPTQNLILVTNFSNNKVELIGRSPDPSIKYTRFVYQDEYMKGYNGTDLLFTIEHRVFKGNTLLFKQHSSIKNVSYYYDSDTSTITEGFHVYLDANKSEGADVEVVYSVYPYITKPLIKIENVTSTSCLRYQMTIVLDNHNDGISLDADYGGAKELNYEDVGINWLDNVPTTAVWKYGNGKVTINYPACEYDIDPTIKIGSLNIEFNQVNKDIGVSRYSRVGITSGDLTFLVNSSKDFKLNISKINSILFNNMGYNNVNTSIELGLNETYYELTKTTAFIGWNNTTLFNGTIISEQLFNITHINIERNAWNYYTEGIVNVTVGQVFVINYHLSWEASVGNRSLFINPLFNGFNI